MVNARLVFWLRLLRRLVVGATLCYVLVVLTLGGTRPAVPTFRTLALLWTVGLALGSFRNRPHPTPAGWVRRLGFLEPAVSSCALALLLGEATLRVYAAWSGPSLLLGASLDEHRLAPGRDYGGGLQGNRLGYPGPDVAPGAAPGKVRVVALGDSFAVGPAVPFAENYLTLLGQALPGIEVCNFGVSGAGPREYRVVLERDGWAVRPGLVLVSVFVGNDITESLPSPRWLDPRGHALYLLATRGWQLVCEHRRQDPSPPTARLAAPPLSVEAFRAVEARRLAVCLTPPGPAMERKWERALGHLDALVSACRQRGVPVAFVLIPDEFQVNDTVRMQALRDAGVRSDAVDLDLPQRRLRTFCSDREVPCLDLREVFASVPGTYAPRDTHWNVRGNRLAARHLAGWLPTILGPDGARAGVRARQG